MNWIAVYKTIAVCLVSIIIEAISATKSGVKWLEALYQTNHEPRQRS